VDLAVLGTHGRSGFDRFLVGSVAATVVRQARCSVLVVPPAAARQVVRHHDAG
jgi:nucleotide-binding universal stress UspA family protein